MKRVKENTKVDVILKFRWKSSIGEHEEVHFCSINIWRDFDLFHEKIQKIIWGKKPGDIDKVSFKAGELFSYSEDNILEISKSQFSPPTTIRNSIEPRLGRFYPLGFFTGLKGVFPQNFKPTRIIYFSDKTLKIDTNIPISKYDIEIESFILDVREKLTEVGGECRDWCAIALENGPGMQVRYNGIETDFELNNPLAFSRADESDDTLFYSEPRITTHIDSKCHENLVNLYENLLPNEGKILDLMSSYQSHIPKGKNLRIIGLGLNEEEMKKNELLDDFIIHDINKSPEIPFYNEEFDAVVCDLSIEYVIKPIELLKEVRRILKKGGILAISFSNRYFPQKVIRLWIDLHEFERMGYVLELLLRIGGFTNYKTFSFRGFRRPFDDKYFGYTFLSDPLYVVYAQKI